MNLQKLAEALEQEGNARYEQATAYLQAQCLESAAREEIVMKVMFSLAKVARKMQETPNLDEEME